MSLYFPVLPPLRSNLFAWRLGNSLALGAGGAAHCVLQGQATIVLVFLSLALTFFILSSFWFEVRHWMHRHGIVRKDAGSAADNVNLLIGDAKYDSKPLNDGTRTKDVFYPFELMLEEDIVSLSHVAQLGV